MSFTIVDPTRAESGALATLVRQLGEEEAQPIPLADPQAALTNCNVVSDYRSLQSLSARKSGDRLPVFSQRQGRRH